MSQFQYATPTGSLATIEAADSNAALQGISGLAAKGSGVMAVPSSQQTPSGAGITQPAGGTPPAGSTPSPFNINTFGGSQANGQSGGQADADAAAKARADAYSLPTTPTSADMQFATQQFQQQIDALNSVYSNQKQAEAIAGTNRIGSNTAIQGRRGLIGSDFGAASTDTQNAANAQAQDAIDAKHSVDLAAIYGKASDAAKQNAADRVAAAQKGADANLEYLKGRNDTNATNATSAIKAYIGQGNDGSKLTDANINDIASKFNVSPDSIRSQIASGNAAAAASNDKKAKDAADLAKTVAETAHIGVPATADEYSFAKSQGYLGSFTQYQKDQDARKESIARAGRAIPQATAADKTHNAVSTFAKGFAPGFQVNGQQTTNASGYAVPHMWKQAISEAPSSGLTRTQFIQNFAYLIDPSNLDSYGLSPAETKIISGIAPAPVEQVTP
jgi:hypothetical protein